MQLALGRDPPFGTRMPAHSWPHTTLLSLPSVVPLVVRLVLPQQREQTGKKLSSIKHKGRLTWHAAVCSVRMSIRTSYLNIPPCGSPFCTDQPLWKIVSPLCLLIAREACLRAYTENEKEFPSKTLCLPAGSMDKIMPDFPAAGATCVCVSLAQLVPPLNAWQ
eukprot:6178395-Pleurochrysis_carterae.AAC.3